jgi:hypothetical protein
VDTAVNHAVTYCRCSEVCGTLLQTSHFRDAVWSTTKHRGTRATLVDAQGAVLVLQCVRESVRQGTLDASCYQRADKIEAMLRDVCKNKLNDMSLEGFDAKKRLAEIKRNRDRSEVEGHAGSRQRGRDKAGERRETSAGVRKHADEERIQPRSRARDSMELSTEGLRSGAKNNARDVTREKQQLARKQCANIHCKDPYKTFIHVRVQCKAGRQDWKHLWDQDLCLRCYNEYLTNGVFDTSTSVSGKRKRGQDQSVEDVRSDQNANSAFKKTPAIKPVERPEKRSRSAEYRDMHPEKEPCGVRGSSKGKERPDEVKACQPTHVLRSRAVSSPYYASQESKHGKVLPKTQTARGAGQKAAPEPAHDLLACDSSKKCGNIDCKNRSTNFLNIGMHCEAGGQDWTQHHGKTFCGRCYDRYRMRGTLDAFVQLAGKRKRSQDQSDLSVQLNHHANGVNTRQALRGKLIERPDKRSKALEGRGMLVQQQTDAVRDLANGQNRQDGAQASENRKMRENRKTSTVQERANAQDKQIDAETCESPRLLRSGVSAPQASNHVKVAPAKKLPGQSRKDAPKEIARQDLLRLHVEGLDGRNCISHVSSGGKLEVLFR